MHKTDASGNVVFDKENAIKGLAGVAVPGGPVFKELLGQLENNPNGKDLIYNQGGPGNVIFSTDFATVTSQGAVSIGDSSVPSYTVRSISSMGSNLGNIHLTDDLYVNIELAQVKPTDASGKSSIDYLLYDIKN